MSYQNQRNHQYFWAFENGFRQMVDISNIWCTNRQQTMLLFTSFWPHQLFLLVFTISITYTDVVHYWVENKLLEGSLEVFCNILMILQTLVRLWPSTTTLHYNTLLHHPFNDLFSRTIWVNRHQKGKHSGFYWSKRWWDDGVAVASAGSYANHLHLAPDR